MSHTWYLLPFLVGLLLGVFAMLGGIEARKSLLAAIDRFGREPVLGRVRVSIPMVSNALAVFGGVGYLVAARTALPAAAAFVIALGAGVAAATITSLIIRLWAVPSALRTPEDPRYVLQGQVARVSRAIGAANGGQIVYELNGKQVVAEARSVDGSAIGADCDVVIERVDGDIAFVEAWSVVEQRI